MNLSTSLAARQSFYEGVPERYLLLSSISFDSSVAGVFWSLSTGGSLILPETGLRSDVFQIASTIRRHRVTHLLCLSSLYSALLNITTRDDLRSLQVAIVAGEACGTDIIVQHLNPSYSRR
jgi:non-ribosomal peptide synthetase component F